MCLGQVPAKAGLSGSVAPDLLRLRRICSREACGLPGKSAVRDFVVLLSSERILSPQLKKKKVLWKENANSENDDDAIY